MTWIPNDIHQDQDLYIRELQTYLRTVATRHIEIPLIAVDGIFGPETTQAVIAFQESFGLEPTGRSTGRPGTPFTQNTPGYSRWKRPRRLSGLFRHPTM